MVGPNIFVKPMFAGHGPGRRVHPRKTHPREFAGKGFQLEKRPGKGRIVIPKIFNDFKENDDYLDQSYDDIDDLDKSWPGHRQVCVGVCWSQPWRGNCCYLGNHTQVRRRVGDHGGDHDYNGDDGGDGGGLGGGTAAILAIILRWGGGLVIWSVIRAVIRMITIMMFMQLFNNVWFQTVVIFK